MLRARVFFLVLVSAAIISPPACAGAFLFPEGEGQLMVTTTFADARKAYDAKGRVITTPSYRKFETKAYLEHGATDWLTIVADGDYFDFHGAPRPRAEDTLNTLINEAKAGAPLVIPPPPPAPHYTGAGVGSLGARVRLFEYSDYVVALEASLRAGASSAARRYLDMKDATQIDARLLFGRPFEVFGFSGFLDAQLGYRSRGQVGDEVHADFTCGVRPLDHVMVMAQSFVAVTPRAPAATYVASQKFQLSAVYDVTKNLSVQAGVVAAPAGVNAPVERGVVTALWWRY